MVALWWVRFNDDSSIRKSSTKSCRPRSIGTNRGLATRYGTGNGSEPATIPVGGQVSGREIPLYMGRDVTRNGQYTVVTGTREPSGADLPVGNYNGPLLTHDAGTSVIKRRSTFAVIRETLFSYWL